MSLRTRVISLLDATGVLSAAMYARRFVSLPYLPIVTYHRVGAKVGDLDPGVVDASAEDFDRQMAIVTRTFTIIGIAELQAHLRDGKPLPKNPALVSFDDGYRECKDVALPILKKYGAKAVFFISTDHMTGRKVFWWDRANYLVKRSKKARISLEYPELVTYDLSTDANKRKAIRAILEVIKTTYALDVETYLGQLGAALDVPWSDEEEKRITDDVLMTWDGVRELRKAGMDIQSHTRTHRVLQTLTPKDLEEELVGSRKELENKLQEEIRAIAYPVGYSIAADRTIVASVRAAGYEMGFSNSTGLGRLASDPFDIQRLSVDPELPHSYFRASVSVPHLTYRR